MKNRLNKFMGVALVLAILTALLVPFGATPVMAGTGTWTATTTPISSIAKTLYAGGNITLLTMASDGTTMYAYEDATTDAFLKSVDAGVTWTEILTTAPTFNPVAAAGAFKALAVLGSNVVVADAGNMIYYSSNAGASFIGMGYVAPAAVTSIDLYLATGASIPSVLVGYSNGAGGGGAALYASGPLGGTWTPQNPGGDALDVAFSANYGTDPSLVAVIAPPAAGNIIVASKMGINPWNLNYAAANLGFAQTATTKATLELPSDFNLSAGVTNTLVGISGTAGAFGSGAFYNNLYKNSLAVSGSGLPSIAAAVFTSAAAATPVYSIDLEGTWASSTTYIGLSSGAVMQSAAISAIAPVFLPPSPLKTPSGASNAIVVQNPTSTDVYVGTYGVGSALSITTDGGQTFNQISLIAVSALNTIAITDVAMVDANTIFLVLLDNTTNVSSLFKTTNGGAVWTRVMYHNSVALERIAKSYPSPAFATDKTVYLAQTDSRYYKSIDGGNVFFPYTAALGKNITAMAIVDKDNYLIATDSPAIYKNGSTLGAATAANVYSIVLASATDIYAGTVAGGIYMSVDSGATFALVGGTSPLGTNVSVAVDSKYATNKTLYAGSSTGMWVLGMTGGAASIVWANNPASLATNVVDVAVGSDGAFYGLMASGVINRQVLPGPPVIAWDVLPASAGSAGGSIGLIALTGNVLYVFNGAAITSYTDTLVLGPTITSPDGKSPVDSTISLSWSSLAAPPFVSPTYRVDLSTDAGFVNVVYSTATGSLDTPLTTLTPPAGTLQLGKTYYMRVYVINGGAIGPGAVHSRYSATMTFQVKLGTETTVIVLSAPGPGAAGVALRPTFDWNDISGATGYELQVADNPVFDPVVTDIKPLYNSVATLNSDLDYSKVYYWRVRAFAGNTYSDWVSGVFTTMAKPVTTTSTPPVTPTTTIIVPTPTVTVELPTSTTAPKFFDPISGLYFDSQAQLDAYRVAHPETGTPAPATPAYIWVIIAIGAVLVIAVVVLIARTRRV